MVFQHNPFSNRSSRFFSEELKNSSSCNPECNFFLPYLWRWYYVILDDFPSCFVSHKLSRMRDFNPSISSLELPWVIFHLKFFLTIVAVNGDNI